MRVSLVELLGGVALLSVVWAGATYAAPSSMPATQRETMKIVLVGDSTVTDKAGWGVGFAKRLGPGVKVVNLSSGGRSSKSFRDEGRWEPALAERGDLVLIQFGHNDQPGKGPERETDPETTYLANIKRYVTEARAAGAEPVVITSLVRRRFGPDGKIRSDLVAYVEAAKRAAAETGATLIDLHARSIEVCEELGREKCETLSPKNKEGGVDTTHLDGELGRIIGTVVAEELMKVKPSVRAQVEQKP